MKSNGVQRLLLDLLYCAMQVSFATAEASGRQTTASAAKRFGKDSGGELQGMQDRRPRSSMMMLQYSRLSCTRQALETGRSGFLCLRPTSGAHISFSSRSLASRLFVSALNTASSLKSGAIIQCWYSTYVRLHPSLTAAAVAETHLLAPRPAAAAERMAVSCIALARSHAIAVEVSSKLSSPRVAGILPPPYSKSTTAFALRLLEPTPKAIVIGPTFSQHADEVETTLEDVQKELGVMGGLALRLPPSVLADGGTAAVAKWTKEQFKSAGIALDEVSTEHCLPWRTELTSAARLRLRRRPYPPPSSSASIERLLEISAPPFPTSAPSRASTLTTSPRRPSPKRSTSCTPLLECESTLQPSVDCLLYKAC